MNSAIEHQHQDHQDVFKSFHFLKLQVLATGIAAPICSAISIIWKVSRRRSVESVELKDTSEATKDPKESNESKLRQRDKSSTEVTAEPSAVAGDFSGKAGKAIKTTLSNIEAAPKRVKMPGTSLKKMIWET